MPLLSVQDSGKEGGESVLRASLDRAAFHGGEIVTTAHPALTHCHQRALTSLGESKPFLPDVAFVRVLGTSPRESVRYTR